MTARANAAPTARPAPWAPAPPDIFPGSFRDSSAIPSWFSFSFTILFLSFFPQIVSGPIARADQLLPQFKAEHRFDWDEFRAGLFRFLWGAFKKLVLADRLAGRDH